MCDLDLCDKRWLGLGKRECAGCARSQFGAMPSPIQVSEDLSLRMSACMYPYLVLLQAICVLICLYNSSTAYAGSSALWYSRLNNVMMLPYSEQLRLEARTLEDKVPYGVLLSLSCLSGAAPTTLPFLFSPRLDCGLGAFANLAYLSSPRSALAHVCLGVEEFSCLF